MKINYNVTGKERKALVEVLSKELNITAKYMGAPTFAYMVENYTINKNGILEGEDNSVLVSNLLGLYDFKAITEEYDNPLLQVEPVPFDLQIPYEEPEAYGIHEKRDDLPYLTVEMPREYFTEVALDNLKKILSSKEELIKKAIGADSIPVVEGEKIISFPWFIGEHSSDEVKAYTRFVAALSKMAKTQKRINATEKNVENEKYAFRCFLLRLGFIGEEYKDERKILLSKLSGNSAFKTVEVEQK